MKKQAFAVILSFAMATSILTGCSTSSQSSQAQSQSSSSGGKVDIFISSPEYTDAINAAISEYKKVAPNVTINYETTQSDYSTLLKAKINSGEIPDIFSTTAGRELAAYEPYSYDLTNQPLISTMTDVVKKGESYNGKILGFPITTQSFGLIYNPALLQKAGIQNPPKTLNEFSTDCQKLKAAGIQPVSGGFKEWWVFKHIFQHFEDAAQPNNVSELVNGFIEGKNKFSSYPVLNDNFFTFIDTAVKYGDAKPLEADQSAETSAFATGKVAMILGQGPWVEADIKKIDANLKIGFAGYPVSNNPSDCKLIVGVDQTLRVNKDSKNIKATLDFCNWLYTSDYGKKWFGNVAHALPPVKDAPYPSFDIASATQEYLKNNTADFPAIEYSLDSFNQKFGEIMQAYIAKTYTKSQAIAEIEKQWPLLGASK